MVKICDHKSVGMLVMNGDKVLLIERKKFPPGFALPAGHVDGDTTFEDAAKRELKEEVGLDTIELNLIYEGRKENLCRRDGGTWHYWKVYKVKAEGEIKRSLEETKQAGWYSKEEIEKLIEKTDKYLNKKITEEDWEKSPGLEPIMCDFFKELKIV